MVVRKPPNPDTVSVGPKVCFRARSPVGSKSSSGRNGEVSIPWPCSFIDWGHSEQSVALAQSGSQRRL